MEFRKLIYIYIERERGGIIYINIVFFFSSVNYQDILLEWNSTGGVLLPNIGLV